ncbi:MAG TPA: response regulator transcription factor [Candidatus Didemnitutus sp.]|nr:response regulator transcription factor [Candidatus Didemnitutus sp.]
MSTTPACRILLVDDHEFLLRGLRTLFERTPEWTVVGECKSAEEAIEMIPSARPSLVVMDLDLPGMDGVDATVAIKGRWPETKVVMLSGQMRARNVLDQVRRSVLAGADAFVSKADGMECFDPAIRAVLRGRGYFSPEAAFDVIRRMRAAESAESRPQLSERERDVLQRLSEGASYKSIAAELELSVKSVETFRVRGMKKLGLASREELVRYARQPGLGRA